MASISCSRQLLRPSTALPIRRLLAPTAAAAAAAVPFSTSSGLLARAQASRPGQKSLGESTGSGHIRAGKKTQVTKKKKKKDFDRSRPPAPGERKAFRKRIQLSNNNALEVPGLEPLTGRSLADPSSVGRVFALPDAVVDRLRAVDAFKPTQCFHLFRQPSVLCRAESVEVAGRLRAAEEARETLRLVVSGDRVSGKSILLLQAMAHAFLNDWIVINIPEAQELTTACTEYAAIPDTEPTLWAQPVYILKLLQSIQKANERQLSTLKTNRAHLHLQNPVGQGVPLTQLIAAAKEQEHAWPVFQALWGELTDASSSASGSAARPPVLLALDGLAHVMRVSDYRTPSFERIHAHDLALVRLFADALSGALPLPNGGAVLAATTRGNAPGNGSVDLALAQRLAEQAGITAADADRYPARDPYFRGYDERVDAALRSVRVLRLRGLDRAEARALMEYWAASGVLRARVDEQAVAATWTLGGNGLVGEMERAALFNLRMG